MRISESNISKRPEHTYEDIIRADVTGTPEYLKHAKRYDVGIEPVSADRYWSKGFHDEENQYLWTRTWQMACMEAEIPNVGDCFHYEISDRSLIITRTEKGIRAFHNACLHRGRKLITHHCNKTEFVCPFHAITWDNHGNLIRNPIAWDMPQWNAENSRLPGAKVATWGGFIFVNMNPDAPSFEEMAGPMIEHLAPYNWEHRYCEFWFEKHVPANWKITAEAFMESHHSQTTHPQLLPSIADINSQYDYLNSYISRHISAAATASPTMDPQPTEAEQIGLMQKRGDMRTMGIDANDLPNDFRTRTLLAEHARNRLTEGTGVDHSSASDAEVLDYILYGVFPNMAFWAGYGPKLVYRWRPEPGNPEGSIMDIIWTVPYTSDKVPPPHPKRIILGYNDRMVDQEPGAGPLKHVFDQDFGNIPHIQTGIKSLVSGEINFSEYTEGRIRYMHQMIDQFIETGKAGEAIPKP